MVFPAAPLAVLPAAKGIALKVATAFGVGAATKVGQRVAGYKRKGKEETDLRRQLVAMTERAERAEAEAMAQEKRAERTERELDDELDKRRFLVRWVFPISISLALVGGGLVGWLLIPGL